MNKAPRSCRFGHLNFGHFTLFRNRGPAQRVGSPSEARTISDFACLRRSGFAQAGTSDFEVFQSQINTQEYLT
jgi:hypothetical protein